MKWKYPYIKDWLLFSKVGEIDKYLDNQPDIKICSHGIQMNNIIIASNKRIFKVNGCPVWASFSTKTFADAINNGTEVKYLRKRISEDVSVYEKLKRGEHLSKEKTNTAYRIAGYKKHGYINGKYLKKSVTERV